jgi:alcohol dehydrogenase class IV
MKLASFKQSDQYAVEVLVDCLDTLNDELEVPCLRDCCGGDRNRFRETLPKMASDALESGSPQNNLRVPSADDIAELFDSAW